MFRQHLNKKIIGKTATYQIKYQLGKGSSAIVYSAINLKNNNYYAIKAIDIGNEFVLKSLLNEIQILKKFDNKNIVKYEDHVKQNNIFFIIMEQGQQSLRNHLQTLERKVMDQNSLMKMMKDIANGLRQIHNRGVIHRDIKIQNIIKLGDDYKITDFGISAIDDLRTTFVGTKLYLAPQIIQSMSQDNQYGNGVDIWSFGILMFEAFFGINPFIYGIKLLQGLNDFNRFLKNIKQITSPVFTIQNVIKKLQNQNKIKGQIQKRDVEFIKSRSQNMNKKLQKFFEIVFKYESEKRANINTILELLNQNYQIFIANNFNQIKNNSKINEKNSKIIQQKPFVSKIKRTDLPEDIYFLQFIKQEIQKLQEFPLKKQCIIGIEFLQYQRTKDVYQCQFEVIKFKNNKNAMQKILQKYMTVKQRKDYIHQLFFKIYFEVFNKKIGQQLILFCLLCCCIFYDMIDNFIKFKEELIKQKIQINSILQICYYYQCKSQDVQKLQNIILDKFNCQQ